MSDTFSVDPAALIAHARRLASYQSDLEQASDALAPDLRLQRCLRMMVGPFIAPLFQLVEAGEQLAIGGAGFALDKLSQSLVASARSFEAREASSSASLSQAGSGLDGGYHGN